MVRHRSSRSWVALVCGLAAVLASACASRDGDEDGPGPRPGFAVEGSVETDYRLHLYRAILPPRSELGVVVQLHPRGGSKLRFQDDVVPPVDELLVCDQAVGFDGARKTGRGSCRTLPLDGEIDIGGGESHVAVELLATGSKSVVVPELVLGYDPADAFLAVEFPS